MLKAVLVILTLAPDGTTHLALSPADDTADCAAKREVVGQILAGAGATVIAARCGQTDLTFAPYQHAAPAEAYVHRWHVHLAEEGPVVRPLRKGEACEERRDVKQPTYCAVSAQAPL